MQPAEILARAGHERPETSDQGQETYRKQRS
jgi:hypothetical protein